MANPYPIARLTEVQERNLWNKWIKPIVELHYNGAIEYKLFTDPEIITHDDIISLWKFTLAPFFYRTTSPGILSTQTPDEWLIYLFHNPRSPHHLLLEALIPLKAGQRDNLVTPFFDLLLRIFENGKLPVFLAYLGQAASSHDTKQNHFVKAHATIIYVPAGTTWAQIHFRIVNPERIEVITPDGMCPYSPAQLGLLRKKRLHDLFETFAENIYLTADRQDIYRLNGFLKNLFPSIKENPIIKAKIPKDKLKVLKGYTPTEDKLIDPKGYTPSFHILIA